MHGLQHLVVSQNSLDGTIPTELGSLSNMTSLSVRNNGITGTLPGQIFTPALQSVLVGNNHLSGSIPLELFTVSRSLTNVDLKSNGLIGTIPPGLSALKSLKMLSLGQNDFTGTLPGTIFNSALDAFDVGVNNIHGPIPDGLFDAKSLKFLNLGANALTGTISERFDELGEMAYLLFWVNQLSGTVPSSLGNLFDMGKFFLV